MLIETNFVSDNSNGDNQKGLRVISEENEEDEEEEDDDEEEEGVSRTVSRNTNNDDDYDEDEDDSYSQEDLSQDGISDNEEGIKQVAEVINLC